VPRARVVSLSAPPASYTAAVERYLIGAVIANSSARIYRISLTTGITTSVDRDHAGATLWLLTSKMTTMIDGADTVPSSRIAAFSTTSTTSDPSRLHDKAAH
jgi:hypothetical protein